MTLVALALVVVQLLTRGLAVGSGWFYGDDLELLTDASEQPLTWAFLTSPHDSQLMPGGLLVSAMVESAGVLPWGAAAASIVVLQAFASLACWAMLSEILGARRRALVPLAFYLFTPMTLPGLSWWASALNQVPVQLAFFLVVLWHVRYLRSGRRLHAVLAVASLVLGLACYVKAVLIVLPVLALSLLWWSPVETPDGSWTRRSGRHLRRHLGLWAAYAAAVVAYVAYYIAAVPNPIDTGETTPYLSLADTVLRRALGPALLGGPWTWDDRNPPLATVATSSALATLSCVGVVVLLGWLWRRTEAGIAPLLVALPYLAVSIVLVARGRASLIGSDSGLELRYLADLAPVLTLALALVLRGPGTLAEPPAAGPRLPRRERVIVAAVLLAVVGGAVVSSVRYTEHWHEFPTRTFVQRVAAESQERRLRVLDEPVPAEVVPGTSFPDNLPGRLFATLDTDRVEAFEAGTDLELLADDGAPSAVAVEGATSTGRPADDCGFLVRDEPVVVPMTGEPGEFFWWLEIAYLAGEDGAMTITAGGLDLEGEVRQGLHRYFVRGEGRVDEVTLRTDSPATVLCVDRVSAGSVEPVPVS